MTSLERIKASHEKHRVAKEQLVSQMKQLSDAHEKLNLDMLAHDGAMQGLALLMQEEEAAGKATETLDKVVKESKFKKQPK